MIVSTSSNGDLAIINFRMLSTDSLEKRADSSCGGSTFNRTDAEDRVAEFTFNTRGPERSIGKHDGDQRPETGDHCPRQIHVSNPGAARQRRAWLFLRIHLWTGDAS